MWGSAGQAERPASPEESKGAVNQPSAERAACLLAVDRYSAMAAAAPLAIQGSVSADAELRLHCFRQWILTAASVLLFSPGPEFIHLIEWQHPISNKCFQLKEARND